MPFYCDLPPDPTAKDPCPKLPTRVIQCISTITGAWASAALDVDSYAEVLLHGDNVTGRCDLVLVPLTTVKKRKGFVNTASLAANWKIELELARLTVNGTTQRAVRDFTHSTGGRRIKPCAWPRLQCPFYTDTLHGKMVSLRGNKCAQVYATSFGFVAAHPMKAKSKTHLTLDEIFRTVGIPSSMIPNNAKELTKGEFKRKCLKAQCSILPVEPYTPNANYAEGAIRELKRLFRRQMATKHIHEAFWDSCLVYCAKTRSSCCLNIPELKGQTQLTYLTGEPTDISRLAEFGYFDMVWFISSEGPDSIQVKRLGRYQFR
jgi:hypothetical protein